MLNTIQPDEISYFRDALEVRTMADVERFEAVPLEDRGLPVSTYDMLAEAARVFPDRPAIHYFESGDHLDEAVDISQAEFFANVNRTANLFHSLGIGSQDVIGLLGPACPEMQYALWGGQAAGVVCPINWMLEPEILISLLAEAGVKALVAYGPDPDFEIWEKVTQIMARMPELKIVVKFGGGPVGTPGVVDFETEIAAQPGDRLLSERVFASEDLAALFHTGGTTGKPKLARHTHANEVFMTWVSALQYGVDSHDKRVCGVPLFHVNGVLTNSLMPIARGAATVIMTKGGWRDPSVLRNLWQIVDRFDVTILPMVPAVVNSALKVPVGDADISSLKLVTSGTAPLSAAVAREFEALSGARIVEGYGLTESTAVSAANPRYGEVRIGSIGFRKAYQPMKVVKLDADGRWASDCAPGEMGIIAISGPNVISGYLDEDANRGLFVADGWMNSGDLGYQDEDGYFWITGRAKDVIIRGGHNIDPKMVEEVLYAHPAVAEAAVVGIPDLHAGELPVAYVALHPDAHVRPGRLKFYAYETIPERAGVPKAIHEVDALPKTAVGKIRKDALREEATLFAAEAALRGVLPREKWQAEMIKSSEGRAVCRIELHTAEKERTAELERVSEALKAFTVPFELVAHDLT